MRKALRLSMLGKMPQPPTRPRLAAFFLQRRRLHMHLHSSCALLLKPSSSPVANAQRGDEVAGACAAGTPTAAEPPSSPRCAPSRAVRVKGLVVSELDGPRAPEGGDKSECQNGCWTHACGVHSRVWRGGDGRHRAHCLCAGSWDGRTNRPANGGVQTTVPPWKAPCFASQHGSPGANFDEAWRSRQVRREAPEATVHGPGRRLEGLC